jgi:hypothetical protein
MDSDLVEAIERGVEPQGGGLSDDAGVEYRRRRRAVALDGRRAQAGHRAGSHRARHLAVHQEERLPAGRVVERHRVYRPWQPPFGRVGDVRTVPLDAHHVDVAADVRRHRAEPPVRAGVERLGVLQVAGEGRDVPVHVFARVPHEHLTAVVEVEDGRHRLDASIHLDDTGVERRLL